jgi:hypothetical protein
MGLSKINRINVILIALFLFLSVSAVSVSAGTTFFDQGDTFLMGNEAPTVESVEVQSATQAPGTSFWASGIINDGNGAGDIASASISCYAPTGTEWIDSWDSIKLANASLVWSSVNSSAVRVNGTFTNSVNYWSLKSANTTWTCKIYGKDSYNDESSGSMTMVVSASAGITLGDSSCVFDTGGPGTNNAQWECPDGSAENNTITHAGNVNLNLTISGTALNGVTDASWTIGVGNMTWNQTTGAVPTSEAGAVLTGSAVSILDIWARGSSTTSNATNLTAWLDYPNPLKVQSYTGTITISSSAS